MHDFLLKLFNCIFPQSETELRVQDLTDSSVVRHLCIRNIDSICTLSSYTDKNIRALIHEAKFHGNAKAFALLNTLFLKYYDTRTATYDCVIPIPLSTKRMRMRGYNQVHEILRANNSSTKFLIEHDVLKRIRDTKPQTELKREQRLTNMNSAFAVMHGEKIAHRHILLVDDVTTTGTTLNTAKATLLPYKPASVTCLALAH